MSNVISLLEALAKNPRRLDDAELRRVAAEMPEAIADALCARDAVTLAASMQLSPTIACYITAPEREEPLHEDAPADDKDEPDSSETRAA